MNYKLQLLFTAEQLQQLSAMHLQVVVAKSIVEASGPYQIIVWQSFQPFESNVLEWQDHYGIYVSTQISDLITATTSYANAVPSHSYSLSADGSITPSNTPAPAGAYNLTNHSTSAMSAGLQQAAVLNGNSQQASAVNAVLTAPNCTISLLPTEQLTLYIAGQYNATTNDPIPIVQGQVLTISLPAATKAAQSTAPVVTVSPGSPITMPPSGNLVVVYDSTTSQFVAQSEGAVGL